jgi:hypothetical protein
VYTGDGLAVVAVAVGVGVDVGVGSETSGDDAVADTLGVGLTVGDTVAVDTGQVAFTVSGSPGLAESVALVALVDPVGSVGWADGVVVGAWVSAAVESSSVDRTAVGVASAVGAPHVCACVDLATADRATSGTMLAAARPAACVVAKLATRLPRVCVPLLSVPPPPSGAGEPPSNTVELATMACRNGCTPSEMAATAAMPASTAPSLTPAPRAPVSLTPAPRAPVSRAPVSRAPVSRAPASPALVSPGRGASRPRGARKAAGHRSGGGQFQVQSRTRSAPPASTLSSQGRGGRLPILARIFDSPSVPGATSSAAADKARRSASSRPSSGSVMRLPHQPGTS